jgi:hypothetical protein
MTRCAQSAVLRAAIKTPKFWLADLRRGRVTESELIELVTECGGAERFVARLGLTIPGLRYSVKKAGLSVDFRTIDVRK